MGKIGALTTFASGTKIQSAQVNSNFSEIKTKVNDYCVFIDVAATITVQHTFNPTGAPFIIGGGAADVMVAGLNADMVDGLEAAAFALASHVHAETDITDGALLARVADAETIAGIWTFSASPIFTAGLQTNTIAERSAAAGVIIDALIKIKDGVISPVSGNLTIDVGTDELVLNTQEDMAARSTGVGTVKFGDATARDNSGFLRVARADGTVGWIPWFDEIGVAE